MKFNLKNIALFLFGAAILASCGNDYDVDEFWDLEELPGYVAFDADGNSITLDTLFIDEAEGSASFEVESPTGTLTDINIVYEISGNAVAGEDYNIDNPGSITITPNVNDFQNRDRATIDIEILQDTIPDGEKILTLTLVSASNGEGDLAIGRGGTDLLKSATVVIGDDD
ncbi:MAG: hypothetical protein AAF573_20125 [Bacteroidota bacterium]